MTCPGCNDVLCEDCSKTLTNGDIYYFQQHEFKHDEPRQICLECFLHI